ncbi:MAG: DUF4055 domain-containing protein, partial [Pseudomonadota bacterium]
NVAHWQSQSDQRNILHVARVPVLFGAGFDEQEEVVIGANRAILAENPDAKLAWVEHTGAAIGAGRQDLKDLEFQMETHGLQLLVARPGAQSATGEALDGAKETSQLSMIADALQDCLEESMGLMGQYAGEDTEAVVNVNQEFGVEMMTAQELTLLLNAVNTGNLSRQTFLEEMARRGMLRPDLDVGKEVDRIGTQTPALTGEPIDLGDDE